MNPLLFKVNYFERQSEYQGPGGTEGERGFITTKHASKFKQWNEIVLLINLVARVFGQGVGGWVVEWPFNVMHALVPKRLKLH